jgi:hypothetical protein
MGVFRGNAAILWTDTDDITTERVLLLREPLRELKPAHTQAVYVADSLDRQSRQTFTVGEGVDEFIGTVRYQDDPQGVIDLVKAGTKGRTVTYVPSLSDGDRRYSCLLISPLSPIGLGMDSDSGVTFGDLAIEIRLRKTDKTPFTDVWGYDQLFSLRAGGRLEEGTFTRATSASNPATYPALAGGGGFGTLTTAKTNIARTGWFSTASSLGPRNVAAIILEPARTNRVLQSANLKKTTVWTATSVTVTSGQSDPAGGTNAYKVTDASTTVVGTLAQIVTLPLGSTQPTLSWFLAPGTGTPKTHVALRSTNGATTYLRGTVAFSSGLVATFATTSKGRTFGRVDRWRNGFYRLAWQTTGTLTTGKYTAHLIPAGTAAAARQSIIAYGPQVE